MGRCRHVMSVFLCRVGWDRGEYRGDPLPPRIPPLIPYAGDIPRTEHRGTDPVLTSVVALIFYLRITGQMRGWDSRASVLSNPLLCLRRILWAAEMGQQN